MNKFFLAFSIVFLFVTPKVFGEMAGEIALGYTKTEIRTPGGDRSFYLGPTIQAKLHFPVYEKRRLATWISLGVRYLSLRNTVNEDDQQEIADQAGLSLGIKFDYKDYFFGAEYLAMSGRHYWIGTDTDSIEYSYGAPNIYTGVKYKISTFADFAISVSYSRGKIPASRTQLSSESPYEDIILWFNFVFTSGISPNPFLDVF